MPEDDKPKTPPAGVTVVTPEVRAAAVKELEGMIAADEGREVGDTPVVDDEIPEDEGEAVNFEEIANEILADDGPKGAAAGPSPEDAMKTKLVAAGLNELTAHSIAHKGGLDNAEKMLAGLTGEVSSKSAHPAPGASEVTASEGSVLSKGLLSQLDGQAKKELGETFARVQESARQEVAELREEMKFLRDRTRDSDAAELTTRLVKTRKELQGEYPELKKPEEWKRVTPLIKAAVAAGFATDGVDGLRAAVIRLYGVRGTDSTGSDNPTDAGKTLKARNAAAGSKAVTQASAKKRIAEMIFSDASQADIDKASARYKKQLST